MQYLLNTGQLLLTMEINSQQNLLVFSLRRLVCILRTPIRPLSTYHGTLLHLFRTSVRVNLAMTAFKLLSKRRDEYSSNVYVSCWLDSWKDHLSNKLWLLVATQSSNFFRCNSHDSSWTTSKLIYFSLALIDSIKF